MKRRFLSFYKMIFRGDVMKNDKIAILIKKTALVVEKISNRMLVPYDLTHTQFKILMMLYRNRDKEIRQADIEADFSMTNPTVTGIIQNLEKKNLVRRVANPKDKRSKVLVLTERAYQMEPEMKELAKQRESQITKNLTEEECDLLADLLKKILENGNDERKQ